MVAATIAAGCNGEGRGMGIQNVWWCNCGKRTPCAERDTKAGATWWCDGCETGFGCVRNMHGRKVWVKLAVSEIVFHSIFPGFQEQGADDAQCERKA